MAKTKILDDDAALRLRLAVVLLAREDFERIARRRQRRQLTAQERRQFLSAGEWLFEELRLLEVIR